MRTLQAISSLQVQGQDFSFMGESLEVKADRKTSFVPHSATDWEHLVCAGYRDRYLPWPDIHSKKEGQQQIFSYLRKIFSMSDIAAMRRKMKSPGQVGSAV